MIVAVVLALATLVARALGLLGVDYFDNWPAAVRVGLAAMLLFASSAHFNRMQADLIRMVPAWMPRPRAMVIITGVLEWLGAAGLLIAATQRVAGWALIALFVALLPANIRAAREHVTLRGKTSHGPGMACALAINLHWTDLVGSVRGLEKIILGCLIFCAISLFESGCRRESSPEEIPTRADVWREIQPLADRYRMDAAFIYALVAAESNFDPKARNGDARGLMQLKPIAWQTVRKDAYEPTVWEWKRNLAAGVEFLAWCRSYLHQKQKFSYPLLLASFHYGIDYVEIRNFDLRRLDPPESAIYRELWRGNLSPVLPPKT